MARHCENALAVARFLEQHPKVAYVDYCGLESSPYYPLAQKYLPMAAAAWCPSGWQGAARQPAPS